MPGFPPWLMMDPAAVDPDQVKMRQGYDAKKAADAAAEAAPGKGAVLGAKPPVQFTERKDDSGDVASYPDIPATNASDDEDKNRIVRMNELRQVLTTRPNQTGAAPSILPGGADYSGAEGEARFNKLFGEDTEQLNQAIKTQADAETAHEAEKEQFYHNQKEELGRVAAVRQAHAEEDRQAMLRRQQDLDMNVQKYSQDLQDTGRFWRNPGNIIAGIGAAMMDFGRHNDDGWKMLQSAVHQDLAQRHQQAAMHLGELRSNLTGYRQIAEDRAAGDLLAESEANRVLASQLGEIGAKFQGKNAQAKAQVLQQQLIQQSDLKRMEAWRLIINTKPRVEQPGIIKAMVESGQWTPYSPREQVRTAGELGSTVGAAGAQNPATQGAAVSALGGKPAQAQQDSLSKIQGSAPPLAAGDESKGMSDLNARALANIKGTQTRTAVAADSAPKTAMEKRQPGVSGLAESLKQSKWAEATDSKGKFHDDWFNELTKQDDNAVAEIGKKEDMAKLASYVKTASVMRNTTRQFEAEARAFGKDPQELWGSAREVASPGFITKMRQLTTDTNIIGRPGGPTEAQARSLMMRAEEMHQKAAMVVNMFLQSQGGKQLTESEAGRYEQTVGTGMNFEGFKKGLDIIDANANTQANAYLNSLPSPRAVIMWKVANGFKVTNSDMAKVSGKKAE